MPQRNTRHLLPAILLFVVLLLPLTVHADPRVELITVGPGDAVWTRFGHVGIRVIDAEVNRDEVVSFGFAPFDQPDFLWSYLRGEAFFRAGQMTWQRTVANYRDYDRTVIRRPLNLPPDLLEELISRLEQVVLPENRDYRYDHLRDNCSTRVRDLLDDLTGGSLREVAQQRDPQTTYRDYTLIAGSGRLLVQIVFDFIGGPNQEEEVDGWAELYLPVYLDEVIGEATIRVDGEVVPLAGPSEVVWQRRAPPAVSGNTSAGRLAVLAFGVGLGVLFLLAGVVARRSPSALTKLESRLNGLLLLPVSLVFGATGLALSALVIVSKVPDFIWNENLLVFVPFDLVLLGAALRRLVLGRNNMGKWLRRYLDLRLLVLFAAVALKLAGVFPQDNWAFVGAMVVALFGVRLSAQLTNPR